ncbi:MAG: RagB/SusD family nutrient uptake outer membrane protein [Chitinophagaceae bacterium]|nr:RagB/SusD family nutrient uptake outer membrane protein [Chitinophagaceae bacterium]
MNHSIKYSTMKLLAGICLAGGLLLSASCKKFLSTYSQNKTFAKTANDLEELLIGQGYPSYATPYWTRLMDDDVDGNPTTLYATGFPAYSLWNFHNWQPAPYFDYAGNDIQDVNYFFTYQWISALNTIIFDIPGMKENGQPADQLERLSGESHFLRALYYFNLTNLYGRPYSQVTAASDYAIPLKTDPAIDDKIIPRSSVQTVFDQIVSDLQTSEKELERYNENNSARANQAAAQALLSRVYLYMSDYENAILYANKVINKNRHSLLNLHTTPTGTIFLDKNSPENIFCAPVTGGGGLEVFMLPANTTFRADNYKVSADLRGSFTANDLRPRFFFEMSSAGEQMYRKAGINVTLRDDYSIRLPEILLNKAEALAALGRNEEAAQTVQLLRKARFAPDQLGTVTETGEALVRFIREERRRELCFESHRWFDLRRYAVNTRYPFEKSIRHTAFSYNNAGRFVAGYYELKPYSQDKALYVAPIPNPEIEFNGGVIKNEERPARPVIK